MLEDAKKLLQELLNNNFEAYLIGGCVRDLLLGQEPTDFDIVTNANYQQVIKVFQHSTLNVETKLVGKQFGVVLVRYNQHNYEIATYRKEGEYTDYRRPSKVEFVSNLKEDVDRRDFTVNGIAMDIDCNTIDYVNGLSDLRKKRLVSIGDPHQRFQEDALRMLRAIRFSCTKDFDLDKELFQAIKAQAHLTEKLAVERINQELKKIMLSDKPVLGVQLLIDTNLFSVLFPELQPMINFKQYSKYHDEDLMNHSLSVLNNTLIFNDSFDEYELLIIRLAAFLHDIGKVETRDLNGAYAHYIGHAAKSKEIVKKIFCRYKISTKLAEIIAKLVKDHDDTTLPKERHVYKFLVKKNYDLDGIKYLMVLKIADLKAHPNFCKEKLNQLHDFYHLFKDFYLYRAYKITDLAIDGNDLIQEFAIEGKLIGETLNYLRDIVFYQQKLNRKDKLLTLAEKYIDRQK